MINAFVLCCPNSHKIFECICDVTLLPRETYLQLLPRVASAGALPEICPVCGALGSQVDQWSCKPDNMPEFVKRADFEPPIPETAAVVMAIYNASQDKEYIGFMTFHDLQQLARN